MKKGLLFIAAMIMMVSTIEAKTIETTGDKPSYNRTLKAQPIIFIEKGIQFSVLPNGEFRFSKVDFKYKRSIRNRTWKNQRGLTVLRDRKGRIAKVGNVLISYSRNDKVTQIGSVDLNYKHGQLKKVGNLYIVHKPNGKIKYLGEVKKTKRIYFLRKPIIWS